MWYMGNVEGSLCVYFGQGEWLYNCRYRACVCLGDVIAMQFGCRLSVSNWDYLFDLTMYREWILLASAGNDFLIGYVVLGVDILVVGSWL